MTRLLQQPPVLAGEAEAEADVGPAPGWRWSLVQIMAFAHSISSKPCVRAKAVLASSGLCLVFRVSLSYVVSCRSFT